VSRAQILSTRLAARVRHYPGADHTELRAELATAKAEQYLEKLIASAPPLSVEQRARLAALLAPPA